MPLRRTKHSERSDGQANRDSAVREFNTRFEFWKQDYRVSVYRIQEDKKLKFLDSYDASQVDEEFIQVRYGAGRYTLKLIDGSGRWLSQATIAIAAALR